MWWECCASQSQLLCLKIPLVNQYLSKHDVEECSLIPNSQHSLANGGLTRAVKFDLFAKNVLGDQLSRLS